MMAGEFKFEISLSVLNHLGRNLYRSFTTILGEAISNAWDADAKNVYIFIDKEKNNLIIKDDGIGMDADDFQNKFLRIGYSKRQRRVWKTKTGRRFIGRKGIGKLALLSCAERISVISKKSANAEYVGGTIDNPSLDNAIANEFTPEQYLLASLEFGSFSQYTDGHNQGTIIRFENIYDGIKNNLKFLKKITALYFRFSLSDKCFNIYINDEKITIDDLEELAEKTQFIWRINDFDDPYIEKLTHLKEAPQSTQMDESIKGFIASVNKPRDLSIMGTGERESVDLFVNGRLRERNILKHIPTALIPESYFYGQIHFNKLDDGAEEIDRFTSSREGIVAHDETYQDFLGALRTTIIRVVQEWDDLRRKHRQGGDPENESISPKVRKGEELFYAVAEEYSSLEDSETQDKVDGWVNDLQADAGYNFASYGECFVAENLLRKRIEESGKVPTSCAKIDPDRNTCKDRYDPRSGRTYLCAYCKGKKGAESLKQQRSAARLSIPIRNDEDNVLIYLDYIDLVQILQKGIPKDKRGPHTILNTEAQSYKPLRNSVMHTSLLTKQAKIQLTAVFHNVVATVKKLVGGS